MAGGLVPQAIVLALGAGALGRADALRLLLQLAGRSAAVDVFICVVVISLLTAPLLGTMLLTRFVRKASPPGGGAAAPATDLFSRMTAAVSVGAALLVTTCLLVVPGGSGLGGAVSLPIDFAVKNRVVVTALAICAAAAAGSLPCTARLWTRFFRMAGSAGGPAPATTVKVAVFVAAMSSLVAAAFVASGGFDAHAQLLFPEFHWRRRSVLTMPVLVAAVAIVTAAGTTLFVRCSRSARTTAVAIVTLSCLLVAIAHVRGPN